MTKRDGKAIVKRLVAAMEKAGLDSMLLSTGGSITYATGYYNDPGWKGNLVVVNSDGSLYYIVNQFLYQAVKQVVDDTVTIVDYPVWIFIEDFAVPGEVKEVQPDPFKIFKLAMEKMSKKPGAKIGVEASALNYSQYKLLQEAYGADNLINCEKAMIEAKSVKQQYEIDILRTAAQNAEIAMHMTAKLTVPGTTMQEIYAMFTREILKYQPNTVTFQHAHTIADQYAPTSMPNEFRVRTGDLVRLDGGGKLMGYNADLGRTYAVGGYCSQDKLDIYKALYEGHIYEIEHIKPGVRMCDVFEGVDKVIKSHKYMVDYGYVRGHYGHSIGCNEGAEEYPMIDPNNTQVFEPGMCFCLESPYYSSKHHTYNIEDTILVTETGIEMFSQCPESVFF